MSIVRNMCAHHARLWNREFTFSWKSPRSKPAGLYGNFKAEDGKRLCNTLVMLVYLLDRINPHSWKRRLGQLLAKHPAVKERSMGFPEDWRERSVWRGQL
ncbi:MAG: hypothetical protein P1P81_05500 [Desulfobulbales bacterium]|nr:hypothetical protein [Desulfobulbales bacterium]